MKKRTHFQALTAIVLLMCMLLSSCSVLDGCNNDEQASLCQHANTALINQKAATCAVAGYEGDTVCTDCGATVTSGKEIPLLTTHDFGDGVVTKEPTCIEKGLLTETCKVCGTNRNSLIDLADHNNSYQNLGGANHQKTCLICLESTTEEHTPTDEGTYYPATCLSPAYTEYTCSVCLDVYHIVENGDFDAQLPHEFSEWEVSYSTCVSEGSMTRLCTREGCNFVDSVAIQISGSHFFRFERYISAPNCTHGGSAEYKCEYCDQTKTEDIESNGLHVYGNLEEVGNGFYRKECSECAHTVTACSSNSSSASVSMSSIATDKALEVSVKEATIELPTDVISQFGSASSVSVSADVLDTTEKSSAISKVTDENLKAALEDAPIYDFSVSVDGTVFSENFDQRVCVTLKYDRGENEADGIVIYYVSSNGEIEAIEDVVYNEDTGEVTFFVEHFSFYGVAYRETQAMKCRRGNHNFEKTGNVSQATCHTVGYTEYACVYCQTLSYDDIVERKPHNYSSIIPASPTCERGDYSQRFCLNEGCTSVLNVEFSEALGHKPDAPASCESPSRCTNEDCGKIITPALSHQWTKWEIITEPTEISAGLRKRVCTRCSCEETSTFDSLGNVDSIEYESYTEFINLVLGEILGITGARIEFEIKSKNYESIEAVATVEKTDDGYRMKIAGKQLTALYDSSYAPISTLEFEFYYDNGAFIAVKNEAGIGSDIENIVPLTFEVSRAIANELHAALDKYVDENLRNLRAFIAEYKALYGEQINEIFAAANLPYAVDDIDTLANSVESVYAYLSQKLGFETNAQIIGQIRIPSAEDIKAVLGILMSSEENNGITTYTISAAPIMALVNGLEDSFGEYLDTSIADFVYSSIEDEAKEIDANLTDFNSIVDFIAARFTGEFTLADAVDMYTEFAEDSNFMTLEELCAFVDELAESLSGKKIDSKQYVEENADKTLNDFAAMLSGDESFTISDFYAYVKNEAANTLVGELSFADTTLRAFIFEISAIEANLDFVFAIDGDGKLVFLSLSHALNAYVYGNSALHSFSLSIVCDDETEVDISEEIKPHLINLTCYYDADGNLVIDGLDGNTDYNFSIGGNGLLPFEDMIIKDYDASTVLGYDVYALEETYWTEEKALPDTYILYNGQYYLNTYRTYSCVLPSSSAVWKEFVADIYAKKDNPGSPIGTLNSSGEYVYSLNIGNYTVAVMYLEDGEWMVSTEYGKTNGYSYYVVDGMSFDSFVMTVSLGMTKKSAKKDFALIDNKLHTLLDVKISYGSGDRTVSLYGVELNGTLHIVTSYNQNSSINIYDFDNPISELPMHSFTRESNITVAYFEQNDTIVKEAAQRVTLYEKLPNYYVKITDGIYTRLDSKYIYTKFDTEGLEYVSLPDKNILYIIGITTDPETANEILYGYAYTESGIYVQTVAILSEGSIIDVEYRNIAENEICVFENMFDANEYITESGGIYTISAELISELKSYCHTSGSYFSLGITALKIIDGKEIQILYNVGAYSNITEEDIKDALGGDEEKDSRFSLFGAIGEYGNVKCDRTTNEDGSITLTFDFGTEIKTVGYGANSKIPVESILSSGSNTTGIKYYTYNGSYVSRETNTYVYRNGNYYGYTTNYNCDFDFEDSISFAKNWRIVNTTYRFDSVAAEGLEGGIPIYLTTIEFDFADRYGSQYIELYTLFIDGVINVAVQSSETGNSLIKFENIMPLDEYMNSLRLEINESQTDSSMIYYRGNKTALYTVDVLLYETDGAGNKLDHEAKYDDLKISYIIEDGIRKYVRQFYYLTDVIEVSDTPAIPNKAENSTATKELIHFYNGSYSIVNYSYDMTVSRSFSFISLAGRIYRVDGYNGYDAVKMTESEFKEKSCDKVWYLVVKNSDTGEETYHTEFIPADDYFTPSGDVVDKNEISGRYETEYLLGYTEEGYPLYEVVYIITEETDISDWTSEPQNDGTVFIHKNGVGYLKVTDGGTVYYVDAKKVQMSDGSYQIYCLIESAVLYGSELDGNNAPFFENYVIADGRKVTLTKEFYDIIKGTNRNEFSIELYVGDEHGIWTVTFNYYQIESMFDENELSGKN